MNGLFFTALFLIGLIGCFLWFRWRKTSMPKSFKTVDEFVQTLVNEAVKNARKVNHIELDYSVESIKVVEGILGKIHEQHRRAPATVSAKGLGSAYGAYVGEVIRRSEANVRWQKDDDVGDQTYPLIWKEIHAYPLTCCVKRIENGPEDNVWNKFEVLKKDEHRL